MASLSLGSVGAFLAIGRTIHRSHGNRFDRYVMHAMGRARSAPLTTFVRAVTALGALPGAIAISLTGLALARRTPRAAAQIAIGALGGIIAELGIKRMFRRQRPSMLEHLEEVSSTSFPSGHSMASSSLYLTLAFVASRGRATRAHRVAILGTASALAASIGATRVYLGVHWPTDVLGGLALGTAWACATEATFDLAGAHKVEREAGVAAVPATT